MGGLVPTAQQENERRASLSRIQRSGPRVLGQDLDSMPMGEDQGSPSLVPHMKAMEILLQGKLEAIKEKKKHEAFEYGMNKKEGTGRTLIKDLRKEKEQEREGHGAQKMEVKSRFKDLTGDQPV